LGPHCRLFQVQIKYIKLQIVSGVREEGSSSADFAAYIRAEIAKWKRVIEAGGIDRI
jgi:hypothetical protein